MIRLDNISIGYGNRELIAGASATIPGGSLTALLGRNGAGKSTLLHTIAGLRKLDSGSIHIDGTDISEIPTHRLSRTVSFVTTEKIRITDMRCRDVVALGRAPYTNWIGHMRREDRECVRDALNLTGMLGFADRTMDSMSDGECQRVMIARALAQDTPVIMLDEPTSFLDLPNRYELCALLKKLSREQGKCIVFSTHELDIALSLCDYIALIDSPELIFGSTEDIIEEGSISRIFGTSTVSINPEDKSITIRRV